ncbi:MAG: hypothetical protein KKA42_10010 [candidate division Zixibacteria bacterium]|nr:hypothetical protein [candidate division Zixibacteria bacterium]
MFFGILLLLIGVVMLLEKFHIIYGDVWDYIVPIALIALGASSIFKSRRHPE